MIRFFMIWLLLAVPASLARAEKCLDVALVFAIDGSGSINDVEYALQRDALVTALADADVVSAFMRAGNVGLAAVIWGDGEFSAERIGWHVVRGGQGIEAFTSDLLSRPRTTWGNTDIGAGIWHALDLLQGICALGLVIDVSGDGKETVSSTRRPLPRLAMARQRADRMDATINGLAMAGEVPDLADYYIGNVITGRHSFVIEVRHLQDFAVAIRKKLIRELQSPSYSMLYKPSGG